MNDTNDDENTGTGTGADTPVGADPFTPVDDSHANTRYVIIAIAVLVIIALIIL
jgi:hypothetical protein